MEKISLCYDGLDGGGGGRSVAVVRICVLKYFVCAPCACSLRAAAFSASPIISFLSWLCATHYLRWLAGMLCNRIMRLQRNNGNKIAGVFHLENI
jgi:hypothetical protein